MPDKLKLEFLEDGLFAISSFTRDGVYYILDVKDSTCTCPAFKYNGHCKHLDTLRRLEAFVEA